MASSLQHSLLHRQKHPLPTKIDTSFSSTLTFLSTPKKLSPNPKIFSSLSTSTSTSTSPTFPAPSPSSTSLDLLTHHLSAKNYRLADDETRRLLIALAGEPAQKRGYVFFSEVQFIPTPDLQAIDALWVESSGGRFGYSVQRKIWDKVRRDFTRFFIAVDWMKKLESEEVDQYNYRAFPGEFVWVLDGDGVAAPPGHLPLTNALRGTQLLGSILTHPAFEAAAAAAADEDEEVVLGAADESRRMGKKNLGGVGSLKSDYSF